MPATVNFVSVVLEHNKYYHCALRVMEWQHLTIASFVSGSID